MTNVSGFETYLRRFASDLQANFLISGVMPAQPEDQLKAPTAQLLRDSGQLIGSTVMVRTESVLSDIGVRPDLGVLANQHVVGHVELKAPGRGANPKRFKGHDATQWKRLSDHPNLIYTDGNEWALYRQGQLVGQRIRFAGDVTLDGNDAISLANKIGLESLFRDFLTWQPYVPTSPRQLAEILAPLCRLLREATFDAVRDKDSALTQLASEWRQYLFPDADDQQFADAYAQTVTYALLLARFEGELDLHFRAAEKLDARHGLLAQVLRLLTDPQARSEVEVPVSLLERTIQAVDPHRWNKKSATVLRQESNGSSTENFPPIQLDDPWLYFYEEFLAVYDPKLRKNRGVYFTPAEVVSAQIVLTTELLRDKFSKTLGFVDDDVVVLDPACGTGTYLLAAIQSGLDLVRSKFGEGAVAGRATNAARNFHGFEILVGPYAVSHLRVAQQVLENGGNIPADGIHVYLTDTLDSPNLEPDGQLRLTLTHRKLAEEHERARKVKSESRIFVCIGNPPYYRQQIDGNEEGVQREGGWVRFGDDGRRGILQDFIDPAQQSGQGIHVKNLYNMYVYFWRWAIWKVLDSTGGPGIVSFITASSYLRGPGYVGMRQKLREVFDEIWIIDLGGEGRGARRSDNVFAIQTPVAIAMGVRYGKADVSTPAKTWYARIDGTESEKLAQLTAINGIKDLDFTQCFSEWDAPLLPQTSHVFTSWPKLIDIFPWQHSGTQLKRTWPIATNLETLKHRLKAFASASPEKRRELFRETSDRTIDSQIRDLFSRGDPTKPLREFTQKDADQLALVQYGYRSFDRQVLIADPRFADRIRPPLWFCSGNRQIYLTSLLTKVLGDGPAAMATTSVPDMDYFSGRGGKDVVPLYRDARGFEPNITKNLLESLSKFYNNKISPEDLFAYIYAILATPTYVNLFIDELESDGPRIPISKDFDLFMQLANLGRNLLHVQTFGERFNRTDQRKGAVLAGNARCVREVPLQAERYPNEYRYDLESQTLFVGLGEFQPVSPGVFHYSISGFPVVRSWLDYRMATGHSQRSSSDLDKIRPSSWPAEFTEELLRVLWILEYSLQVYPAIDEIVLKILGNPLFEGSEFPIPDLHERTPPDRSSETPQVMFEI